MLLRQVMINSKVFLFKKSLKDKSFGMRLSLNSFTNLQKKIGLRSTEICVTAHSRREQYYWVRYWYWVILGCFRNIAIGIGIVKGLSKYWYWYWVLLRAFQSIGILYC